MSPRFEVIDLIGLIGFRVWSQEARSPEHFDQDPQYEHGDNSKMVGSSTQHRFPQSQATVVRLSRSLLFRQTSVWPVFSIKILRC